MRLPLSLRNGEDLLFKRRIDLCDETVRTWWNRFGSMLDGVIRRRRVTRRRGLMKKEHTRHRWPALLLRRIGRMAEPHGLGSSTQSYSSANRR